MSSSRTLNHSSDEQQIGSLGNDHQLSVISSPHQEAKAENLQITFVCCVESGSLESQTVRTIESLRRWGGRFANAPVIAVTPRWGLPLAHQTLQDFERLNVEHLRFQTRNKYSWYNFLNKPEALAAVEKRSQSEYIGWLDSDLLFVGEPDQLILNEGEDFVACAPDRNGATTGPGDPFEPFWRKMCNAVGLDVEDLPWITTEQEGALIRLYWNGGIFVYRRSTNFASHYLQTCNQVFDACIASQECGIFFNEQIVLGLAMVKTGISWRALFQSHNFHIGSKIPKHWNSEAQLKLARIIHYHDSMWPDFWPKFIAYLQDTHPQATDWLVSIGALKNEAPFYYRSVNKVIKSYRKKQESAYKKLCKVI